MVPTGYKETESITRHSQPHVPKVQDTPEARRDFLRFCDQICDDLKKLRQQKESVYGMNWMKRGFDSTFQNIDRKFGIVEEIMWSKIIQKREQPTDKELVYLWDGLLDLSNYCQFALWFMSEVYRMDRLVKDLAMKREV